MLKIVSAPLVYLCLLCPARHAAALAELPAAERERAGRFLREEDRARYVLGRTAIRRLGAEFLGGTPAKLAVPETVRGKPYFAPRGDGTRMEFNVSHSAELVAIAWSEGCAVGVDLEPMGARRRAYRDLARTAFSTEEQAVVSATAEGELEAVFLRIWVRKEAIVKADGCGIAGALQRFSVVRREGMETRWAAQVATPDSAAPWALIDFPGPRDFAMALAAAPGAQVQAVAPRRLGWR